MCGIAGVFGKNGKSNSQFTQICSKLIKHRGPDSINFYEDNVENINLLHCRLSIIDLTANGRQPIISNNNRYIIIFNGEIYNFKELRDILIKNDYNFFGSSDTEVLVNYFEFAGVDKTLQDLNGMYAIALYDLLEKKMILMRDDFGEKPLFYLVEDDSLYFCSEPSIFRSYFKKDLSVEAMSEYLNCGFKINSFCIYQDVKSILPGERIIFDYKKNKIEITNKGLIKNIYCKSKINSLEKTLYKAVEETMVSEVPLGAFLSGGIDSSLIVKIMSDIAGGGIETFTIGYENKNYDESKYAQVVSEINKTNHNVEILDDTIIAKYIPEIINKYDEPLMDMSFIPTYIVSKNASKKVKVCMSGDGGDELFLGYNRYLYARKIKIINKFIPNFLASKINFFIKNKTQYQWDEIYRKFGSPLSIQMFGERLYKLCNLLSKNINDEDLYLSFFGLNDIKVDCSKIYRSLNYQDDIELEFKLSYLDRCIYLPNNILQKSDRASMLNSLEVRSPFLNKRIVEYANSRSKSDNIKFNLGKHELRKLLFKLMPELNKICNRKKMGFALPIEEVLRGNLSSWVHEMLMVESPISIHDNMKNYEGFIKGDSSLTQKIWRSVVFNCWYKNNFLDTHSTSSKTVFTNGIASHG